MNFLSHPLASRLKNVFHGLRTEGRRKTIKRRGVVTFPFPCAPLAYLWGPQVRLVTLFYFFVVTGLAKVGHEASGYHSCCPVCVALNLFYSMHYTPFGWTSDGFEWTWPRGLRLSCSV
jgi:hypothetical protein